MDFFTIIGNISGINLINRSVDVRQRYELDRAGAEICHVRAVQ